MGPMEVKGFWCCVLLGMTIAGAEDSDWLLQGWRHTGTMAAQWKPEPWRVRTPDPEAGCAVTHEGPLFSVPTPGTAMAWTLTVTPIWVKDFPLLRGSWEYRGTHADATESPMLLGDASTGPVTPGANNPENPLASGGQLRVGESATSGMFVLDMDLSTSLKTDRVAEISIFVQAGAGPAELLLHDLGFYQAPPAASTETRVLESAPDTGVMTPLPIARQMGLAEALRGAFDRTLEEPRPAYVTEDGAVFSVADDAAAATTVAGREEMVIETEVRTGELQLLLGARVFGSDDAWYGGGTGTPRTALRSPLEASVVLTYADGHRAEAVPHRRNEETGIVSGEVHGYRVALDATRTLRKIVIRDGVDYGQLVLLGASVTPGDDKDGVAPMRTRDPSLALGMTGNSGDARTQMDGGTLRVETAAGGVTLTAENGGRVTEITRAGEARNLLDAPTPLFTVAATSGEALAFGDGSISFDEQVRKATGVWKSADGILEVTVEFRVGDAGEIRFSPQVRNLGGEARTVSVMCPSLAGIAVSASGAADYLLGTRTPTLATAPGKVEELYGAGYLMQFADMFDAGSEGGLGVIVEDTELWRKQFHFEHTAEERSSFSVGYTMTLGAGETRPLPPFVLLPHAGDWHATFEQYRAWTRKAFPVPQPHALRKAFYCRRDYPLGGTGYLYDVPQQRYTAARLAEESVAAFGGVDFIDISSWAYHEASGRVGDYLANDLGGLEGMHACVDEAHAKGALLGLYFEGYLVDKRCPLAAEALPAWQMIQEDGKGKWWNAEMEFFCCPGVADWRRALIGQVVEVAARTGADAAYLDQLGNTGAGKECWSTAHGHEVPSNPLLEEKRMIEETRAALAAKGLHTALYIEHVPCDGMAHLIDGAFNISIAAKSPTGPTRLPLQRFVFPEIAIFEMLAHGIRPVPAEEEAMRLAFFHGMGLWLKGRGNSWFSPGFRAFAQQAYPVYQQYADLFRSPDCVPLIPTLQAGVYANSFGGAGRQLITLYNAEDTTIDGPLLELQQDAPPVEDLLQNLQARQEDGILHGRLEPGAVAAILLSH